MERGVIAGAVRARTVTIGCDCVFCSVMHEAETGLWDRYALGSRQTWAGRRARARRERGVAAGRDENLPL
jgi:hypothetical protein